MELLKVKVVSSLFSQEELLPEYKTPGSAGMDLRAAIAEPVTLKPGEIRLVPSGIAISLGETRAVALVYARSGLAAKHGIALANGVGVIDADYRGEILCPLINQSQREFTLNPLERMAQLVITPMFMPPLEVVEELDDTQRGSGGFGHTGK